jgi:hypothetical protein
MTVPDPEKQGENPPVADMQPVAEDSRSINDADRGQDEENMAVQTKDLRSPTRPWPKAEGWPQRMTLVVYGITALLVVLTGYALLGVIVERVRTTADDMRYGRPRTTHLTGFVGHSEERGIPTHIIAMNLDRQVTLIEIPGSDPKNVRAIEGPYLFGADQALTPIEVQLQDIDGDGTLDLLLTIQREQVFYLNKDGVFRLPTPAEQAALNRGNP